MCNGACLHIWLLHRMSTTSPIMSFGLALDALTMSEISLHESKAISYHLSLTMLVEVEISQIPRPVVMCNSARGLQLALLQCLPRCPSLLHR